MTLKTFTIAKKEFTSYFTSSMAYILLFVTISVFNFFFFLLIDQNREASLRDMFLVMEFMFIFIIPLFTMKTFAEEKRTGTLEFLMTSPVTNGEIVLGKYLGNLLFVSLLVAMTAVYYFIIEFFSAPDIAPTLSGYFGIWLEVALFVALGIFISSLTKNQLIAALSAYVILLVFYFAPALAKSLGKETGPVLDYISFSTHLKNLSSGLLLTSDIVYYLSGILFCLLAARVTIENKALFHSKFQSTIKVLLVLSFFIAAVALNYLGLKRHARLDLTAPRQHTLSQETVNILKNLEQDIQVTVLYVGLAPNYLKDLLGEYERFSEGKLRTEIIDPLVDLGYAVQFGKYIDVQEKKAIVQAGSERRDVDFTDEELLGEERLTNAILKTTRPKRGVYFLSGHNEFDIDEKNGAGYSKLKKALEEKNYTVQKLFLGSASAVPQDCDVLIIGGPKSPLPQKEEKLIQDYLERGGKALFLIESAPRGTEEQPLSESDKLKNPSLNSILNRWGIEVGNDIVVDLENHVGGDVGCPATRNYPKQKEIVSNLDYTFYIRPRSIAIAPGKPESVKIAPLVFTASSKNSWVETNPYLHVKFDEKEDTRGPISIAAVAWEPKGDKKSSDTKVIVFTDGEFVTNDFIGQYSNADILANSLQWLAETETMVTLGKKNPAIKRLDLTSKQIRLVTIALFAIPILILGLGFLAWWRPKGDFLLD